MGRILVRTAAGFYREFNECKAEMPVGVDLAEVDASLWLNELEMSFTAAFILFLNYVSHLMNKCWSKLFKRASFFTFLVCGFSELIIDIIKSWISFYVSLLGLLSVLIDLNSSEFR